MKKPLKVLIVGAGAAGLSCARELNKAQIPLHILEARNRVGGRAFSLNKNQNIIEYGAEFIHGAQPLILEILQKNGFSFTDVCDNRLLIKKGKVYQDPKFWEDLEKITQKLNAQRKTDRSIADFIEANESKWDADLVQIFKSYVEGYQAADLSLAGEKGLAAGENQEEPELNGQSQFRPDLGYSHFMQELYDDAGIRDSQITLNAPLDQVHWDENKVQAVGQMAKTHKKFRRQADLIVLTAPINVLKTSLVVSPAILSLQKSLQAVPMGHLQRFTFEFAEPFWQKLSDKPVGFLHAHTENYFPTWWSQAPKRNNLLIAWQGGPKAYEMSFWSEAEKIKAALQTLSRLTGRSFKFVQDRLVASHSHDWSQDPYSLGAYCYAGLETRGTDLTRVFGKRILIAGEGTMTGADQGTVHGAIKSGIRTARKIIKLNSK